MLPGVQKIEGVPYSLGKVQDALTTALGPVLGSAIVDGRLIEGVALASGSANTITHGLGRPPKGWLVVRSDADARYWDDQANNSTPGRTLRLNSSATATVSLWVF
jgi:hypothetical protein